MCLLVAAGSEERLRGSAAVESSCSGPIARTPVLRNLREGMETAEDLDTYSAVDSPSSVEVVDVVVVVVVVAGIAAAAIAVAVPLEGYIPVLG